MTTGRDRERRARRADTRIDDRKMYGSERKIRVRSGEPKTAFRDVLRRDVVREIDDQRVLKTRKNDTLHDADERIVQSKVGEKSDDAGGLGSFHQSAQLVMI